MNNQQHVVRDQEAERMLKEAESVKDKQERAQKVYAALAYAQN